MPTTTFSIGSLLANCDDAFPAAGDWGYMTLLKGDLTTGLGYTANAATNALTTTATHGLVTGSRIRFVGGTLPTPLLANTDYYAIVSSPTILSVSATLGGGAIDLTDAGAGALTLTEQAVTSADSLAVLVNKEISHPSWTARTLINNLGAAVAMAGVAEKPTKTLSVANSGATALSYQHYLFVESTVGSTATLRDVPAGAGFILSSESAIQTLGVGDPPRAIFFKLRARNA